MQPQEALTFDRDRLDVGKGSLGRCKQAIVSGLLFGVTLPIA